MKNVLLETLKKEILSIINEEIKLLEATPRQFGMYKGMFNINRTPEFPFNPQINISRIKDRDGMALWIMRQFFDPDKHSNKPWYDKNVNKKNVIKYIFNPQNKFPYTPRQIVRSWYDKIRLDVILPKYIPDEKEKSVEPEQDVKKYQKGEGTLDDIATEFGLTKQAARSIIISAGEKVKHLTKGVSPWELDEDDMKELFISILELREDIADKFAKNLKTAKGNIKDFFKNLVVDRLVTIGSIKEVDQNELDAYVILAEKSENDIKHILMTDIEQDDNLFKLYQFAISKSAFPEKRGKRPKIKKT